MKHSIKHLLGGALLLALPLFLTSCDDILGQWDKPAPTSIVISQGIPTISITADDLKLYVDDTDTRIGTASTGATVNYASSDESIATVDANGKVTAVGVGTATITASVDPTEKFTGASATYNVIVSKIDVRLNPLYYVAERNVQSYDEGTKVVTFDSDPASLVNKTVYTRSYAMTHFAKQTTYYDDVYWGGSTVTDANNEFYYHLPCIKEWNTVIPDDFDPIDHNGNTNPDIFGTDFYQDGGCTFKKTNGGVSYVDWPDVKCIFGYDATTKAGINDNSYWNSNPVKSDVRYAIRFLGTEHCSVWKYQNIQLDEISSGKYQRVLVITAKIIDKLEKTDTSLETILAEYMAKDDAWWNNNNENAGAVQREFYTQGRLGDTTPDFGNANVEQYIGFYWSTTEDNRSASNETRMLHFGDNDNHVCLACVYEKHHFSVRLFREPKE